MVQRWYDSQRRQKRTIWQTLKQNAKTLSMADLRQGTSLESSEQGTSQADDLVLSGIASFDGFLNLPSDEFNPEAAQRHDDIRIEMALTDFVGVGMKEKAEKFLPLFNQKIFNDDWQTYNKQIQSSVGLNLQHPKRGKHEFT